MASPDSAALLDSPESKRSRSARCAICRAPGALIRHWQSKFGTKSAPLCDPCAAEFAAWREIHQFSIEEFILCRS